MPNPSHVRIGDIVTYVGDQHPAINGHLCRVVSIYRDFHIDPERGPVLRGEGAVARDDDLVEIAPFLGNEGRWSCVAHDANLEEIDLSQHYPAPDKAPK